MTTRAEIVAIARSYLGTPYHHRGRQSGVSMDCAGVIICVARDIGAVAPDFEVPNYVTQPDGVTMTALAARHLGKRVQQADMRPGDALVLRTGELPHHLGIVGDYRHGGLSIIHASGEARPRRVIETRLMFSRSLKFVAAFQMPGVTD